jgi:hypothetical protein
MTSTQTSPADITEALAGRLFEAGLGAFELCCVHLGVRLGLYRALAHVPALTAIELAAEAGIDARYAREWCEQQAAGGYLTVDHAGAAPDGRRYTLPTAAVLLDPESPAHLAPLGGFLESVGRVFPALERAYRDGGGVPYADYGVQDIQAAVNRPLWTGPLVGQWLPALPELHARLSAGATVAEFGCGQGLAAVTLARTYPRVHVHGFDLDDTSIEAARWRALTDGVADRVRFEVADVATPPASAAPEGYDAVFAFEMLHDLARPVEALRTARLLARGGTSPVIVMEGRTAELFQAPADPAERFRYASSVLHCLPVGRCEPDSAATGTVLRPATLRAYAEAAGFARVQILPFEHEMFRCYLLEG